MALMTARAFAPYPAVEKPASSRNRAPMGGKASDDVEPASCRAGQRWWLLVSGVVKRMAWSMVSSRTSLQRSRPGRIGSPAASAEVQESGRSRLDVSDQTAPDPARQVVPETRVFQVS